MELAARRPADGPPVTRELLFEVVQVNRHVYSVPRPKWGSRNPKYVVRFGAMLVYGLSFDYRFAAAEFL